MGFRSLLEINHDTIESIANNPALFVLALQRYVNSACSSSAAALAPFCSVVGLRHSADPYIISKRTPGFPTSLPYDEFRGHSAHQIAKAKAMVAVANTRSRLQMANMITELVDIIERLSDDT